jgi:hypothetical protein
MPTTPLAPSSPTGDPFAPAPRRPWYRRRVFLIVSAVVVIIAITVITDLPTSSSRDNNISNARSVIAEVASDVQPCNYGLGESLIFYNDVTSGHITAQHRAQIPGLISQDLEACSYSNAGIDDLADVNGAASKIGSLLNSLADHSLLWCDPDGLSAIGAMTTLINDPGNAAATSKLARAEKLLASDRAIVYSDIATITKDLGTSMHSTLTLKKIPIPS